MEMRYQFRVWNLMSKKMMGWGEIFDLPAWEIFPGTPEQRAFNVMQYTGLKDKDGTDIYEGDIFEENYFDIEFDEQVIKRYEVIFNNGAFMAKPIGIKSSKFPLYLVFMFANKDRSNDMKVLGNIYETPELLKTK